MEAGVKYLSINNGKTGYYVKAGGMRYTTRYVTIKKQKVWVKDLKKGEERDQQMSST